MEIIARGFTVSCCYSVSPYTVQTLQELLSRERDELMTLGNELDFLVVAFSLLFMQQERERNHKVPVLSHVPVFVE